MEKGRQEAAYKMNASVFEGAISEDELQALGQLLDATDLRNLHHQNQMSGTRMQEALVISLSIPREQETQQLLFSSYRNSGPHGEHAGAVIDDISLIQPLQKWLKASIENKKPAPVKSAKPNSCAPVL